MNCSLMNLAHGSPMSLDPPAHGITKVIPFEIEGRTLDLALYSNFEGLGWGRVEARRFLQRTFLRDRRIRPLHLRTPALFDSNHSAFFSPAARRVSGQGEFLRQGTGHEEVVDADRRVVP